MNKQTEDRKLVNGIWQGPKFPAQTGRESVPPGLVFCDGFWINTKKIEWRFSKLNIIGCQVAVTAEDDYDFAFLVAYYNTINSARKNLNE